MRKNLYESLSQYNHATIQFSVKEMSKYKVLSKRECGVIKTMDFTRNYSG